METIIQQLNNNADALKSLRLGQQVGIKAATVMTELNNVTGAGTDEINPQLVNYIPKKGSYNQTIYDLLPKISVDTHSIVVVNEANDDGTIAAILEDENKSQIDFDDNVTTQAMSKYTAYVKISREMLNDIPFMNDQITRVLYRRLKDAISTDIIGALTGVTPELLPAALTAGTGATTIKDCILGVTHEMQMQKGYTPNLFLFNAPDISKLYIQSVANEYYPLPKIMASNIITAGNILGLDTSMFPVYIYKDIDINFGYTNDDFTKNLVTIVAETRLTYNFVGNSLNAIYNDVIADTITALA